MLFRMLSKRDGIGESLSDLSCLGGVARFMDHTLLYGSGIPSCCVVMMFGAVRAVMRMGTRLKGCRNGKGA